MPSLWLGRCRRTLRDGAWTPGSRDWCVADARALRPLRRDGNAILSASCGSGSPLCDRRRGGCVHRPSALPRPDHRGIGRDAAPRPSEDTGPELRACARTILGIDRIA